MVKKIIGPILGAPLINRAKIIIGLPDHINISELSCKLYMNDTEITALNRKIEDGANFGIAHNELFRVFIFNYEKLDAGKYNYKFYYSKENAEKELDLDANLTYEDCYFWVDDSFSDNDSFILLSCHKPFDKNNQLKKNGWKMWEELYGLIKKEIEQGSRSIKMLIMAGDQVYNDDIETEYKKDSQLKNNKDKLINRFIEQYHQYWNSPFYKKIVASVPSLAIWDDHDITDGWGSRNEFIDNIPRWQNYYNCAKESYKAYQHSRNLHQLEGCNKNQLSHYCDFGANRIYFLDIRSERNIKNKIFWSQEQQQLFFNSLDKVRNENNIHNIFVVLSTVPFRTNLKTDEVIVNIGTYVPALIKNLKKSKFTWCGWFVLLFYRLTLEYIFDLTDDVADGLSSEANINQFTELLLELHSIIKSGKTVILLSGDIHLGGLTEILLKEGDKINNILQIVSSPISNDPMPKMSSGITTTTSEMTPPNNQEITIKARNIFYISKRNFVRIYPEHLSNSKKAITNPPIHFYLEEHEFPITFSDKFYSGDV